MSFIVITRYGTGDLTALSHVNGEPIEFTTEAEAERTADQNRLCQIMGYQIIEVEVGVKELANNG